MADGFTDFTRTQHDILEILARRAEEVIITLPLESAPGREDLFAKPAKTLAELQRRHPGLVVERAERTGLSSWPAMAHLEATIFANPRQCRPLAEKARGIEVLAASRELGEIEMIGARIKHLLTQGCEQSGGRPVRPGEIAVVFRSPAAAGPLVREVFGRLGIPVALESGRSLDRAKALVALAGLVRLDVEDWPFRGLLAVLANSYFRPDWPEWADGRAVAAAGRLIRTLQVPHGSGELLARLRRLTGQPASEADGTDGPPSRRAGDAPLALALLERLHQTLGQMPRRATLGGWASAWQRLAEDTGLVRTVQEVPLASWERAGVRAASQRPCPHPDPLPRPCCAWCPGEEIAVLDTLAWQQLHESLRAADTLSEWMGRPAAEIDRRQALAELLDVLSSVQIREPQDETGRVRVVSARSVRALSIPYVFLAGLSEKAFPPPDREDRLYGEPEAQRLIEAGLPLVARLERNREEMLLFYEAVTRATRGLWLSYPALDEAAQPLAPSPYLAELEQACGPGMVPRTEDANLSPVPQSGEPLCEADFRVRAVAEALEGDASLLAGLVRVCESGEKLPTTHHSPLTAHHSPLTTHHSPPPAQALGLNLLSALRTIGARSDRERFGASEGMLHGEAVRASVAGRYSLDCTFSATELERYASCPFRFYLESVLGLEPLEDLGLAVDYLERGRLAHEALATLHAAINRAAGRPVSPAAIDAAEYEKLLEETLAEVLSRPAAHPVAAALHEVDRRLLAAWLAGYRDQHAKYDDEWADFDEPPAPAYFEVSFGRPASAGAGAAIDRPLVLSSPQGTVRLSGRIDRVDVGRAGGQAVFNVLDYKTGGSTAFSLENLAAGTALQLPVYAVAVETLLLAGQGAAPYRAGYWYLKDAGFKPRQALAAHRLREGRLAPDDQWPAIRDLVAETVGLLAEALRRAEFPVYNRDEECTRTCPFSTVCRVGQVRWLEKSWGPGAGTAMGRGDTI